MAGTFQIAEAQLDYEGEGPDDLGVQRGDVLLVSQRDEIGWWVGVCRGEVGLVPENFVRLCGAAEGLDALVQQEVAGARTGAIADEHLRQVLLLGADQSQSHSHSQSSSQDQEKEKEKEQEPMQHQDRAILLETHRTRLGERLGQLVEESHHGWIRRAEQEQAGTLLSGQIAESHRERHTLSHAALQQRTTHTQLLERLRFLQHNSATHAATHDALRNRCADLRDRIRAHTDAHTDAHANALRNRAAAADTLRQQTLLHTRLRQLHADLVLEQRRLRPGKHSQSLLSPRAIIPHSARRVYPGLRDQDASADFVRLSAGADEKEGDNHNDDDDDADEAVPYVSQREIQRQESLLQLHSRGVSTPRSVPASQRSTPVASPMIASSPVRDYLSAVATPRSLSRTQSEVSQIEGELYRSRFPHRVPKSPS